MASKLSFHPGPGCTPSWGPLGLGVCPSVSASIALASSVLVSVCWYRIMAMGEMGEGEQDRTSSMKVGMTGEVYVEFVAEVAGGVTETLLWK